MYITNSCGWIWKVRGLQSHVADGQTGKLHLQRRTRYHSIDNRAALLPKDTVDRLVQLAFCRNHVRSSV